MPRKLQQAIKEGEEVDTQAVAAEISEELAAPPTPKPATKKATGLFVYAPFDLFGRHYDIGDDFTPPAEWQRDTAFDEFRGIEKRRGTTNGVAFNVPGEVIDKKTGERAGSRMILPVKEA